MEKFKNKQLICRSLGGELKKSTDLLQRKEIKNSISISAFCLLIGILLVYCNTWTKVLYCFSISGESFSSMESGKSKNLKLGTLFHGVPIEIPFVKGLLKSYKRVKFGSFGKLRDVNFLTIFDSERWHLCITAYQNLKRLIPYCSSSYIFSKIKIPKAT